MKKKFLVCLLILFAGIFVRFTYAYAIEPGEQGDSSDGKYTITRSTDGTTCSIDSYLGSDSSVIIPEEIDGNTVTTINDCFYDGNVVTAITIPKSVMSISSDAFSYCSALTGIEVNSENEQYSSIDGVLYNHDKSRLIFYPKGLTASTFSIPASVTYLGDYVFSGCNALTAITIPGSCETIGANAFRSCQNLASVTIENGVASISEYAFSGCRTLAAISMPNTITTLGKSAFEYCSNLSTVTISTGVTKILDDTFKECIKLTDITIPGSVTDIGASVFYKCTALDDITIPDSVLSIGEKAFEQCTALSVVNLSNKLNSLGAFAFRYSSGLTNITLPDSLTIINNDTFNGCAQLASVTMNSGIVTIGADAFMGCNSLTNIIIPKSVTSIGGFAFSSCSSLTSITIPGSVAAIGEKAFQSCGKLAAVYFDGNMPNCGTDLFKGCNSESNTVQIYCPDNNPGGITLTPLNKHSHAIKVDKTVSGYITPSTSTGIPGETISLVITVPTGYKLMPGSLRYNSTPINGSSFIMPDNDITITAMFVATGNIPKRGFGIPAAITKEIPVNQAFTLDLAIIFDGGGTDTLTFKVAVNDAAAISAAANYSYIPKEAGITTLVFTANNGTADSTDTFTVTLTALADQPGCLVTYRGSQRKDNDDGTMDIRLIATINTLNADEVGFVLSKTQKEPTKENATVKATKTVYTSVIAAGKKLTAGSQGGTYIFVYTVTGIPKSDINVPLYVRAFSTVGANTKYTATWTVTGLSMPI